MPIITTAVLAGGCFWGLEELIGQIPGVTQTEVGYAGGDFDHPSYEDICTGRTGHAESVRVHFDAAQLTYEALLLQFFKMHDPTTHHQQGNDLGSQYRSVIFYQDEAQRRIATEVMQRVEASKAWKKPLVTELVPASPFWMAEEYHQHYLQKNPGGYTCHFLRDLDF